MTSNGIFLPKLFDMYPKTMLHISAPTDSKLVTQEASSMFIFPLGNGLSSDVSKMFIGEDQPSRIPKATIKRFTVQNKQNFR